MIACIAAGDSLAVGVGQQMVGCRVVAQVGISSAAFVRTWLRSPLAAEKVVISLGANDGMLFTGFWLNCVRDEVKADRVYWLLPAHPESVRLSIEEIARERGDSTIDTKPYVKSDGVHPDVAGYRKLAAEVK